MLNIIRKNIKDDLKSPVNLLIFIAFMLELIGMNIIAGQFPEVSTEAVRSGFVETIVLGKFAVIKTSQGYAGGLVSIFILFMGGIGIGKLAAEREENTLLRMYSAPVSKFKILLSYVVSTMLFILLTGLSLIAFCKIAMDIEWGNSLSGILFLTFSGAFVSVCMGFVFCAFLKTSKAAIGAYSVMIIIMSFFSAPFDPYRTGRTGISALMQKFTLNHWLHSGYVDIMSGKSVTDIIPNISLLLVAGAIMFCAALFLFRKENFYE